MSESVQQGSHLKPESGEVYLLARDIRPGDVVLMEVGDDKVVTSNDGHRITYDDGTWTTALVSAWVERGRR